MAGPKLTDDEAYALLHAAWLALGQADGETIRADTAMKAARRALIFLQLGLLKAIDEDSDRVSTIRDRDGSEPQFPST